MTLEVSIVPGEDGWFVVEVPALPGCVSQGKTREEAILNIQEAIEGWLIVEQSKHASDPHAEIIRIAV